MIESDVDYRARIFADLRRRRYDVTPYVHFALSTRTGHYLDLIGQLYGVKRRESQPCPHCGLPDKSLWRTRCRYTWWMPFEDEFVRSGADRPCALDAYKEESRAEQAEYAARMADEDRRWRALAVRALLSAGAIAVIWVLCYSWSAS